MIGNSSPSSIVRRDTGSPNMKPHHIGEIFENELACSGIIDSRGNQIENDFKGKTKVMEINQKRLGQNLLNKNEFIT